MKFALPIGLLFVYYTNPMKSINDIHKKRGRPATGKTPMLTFRAGPDIQGAIERAAKDQGDAPNRSEMIRRIVADWLRSKGYLQGP